MNTQNNNNRSQDRLKALLGQYLQMQGINIKHNFTCLNPNHSDKNPSMTYYSDDNRVYCHGCGARYDIFDLYAIQQQKITPDSDNHVSYRFKEIYNEVVEYMHADVNQFKIKPEDALQNKINEYNRRLIEKAAKTLDKTDYLQKRGISQELGKQFHIGFIPEWINPTIEYKAGKGTHQKPTPRLIIPTGVSSYLARDTRDNIPDAEKRYIKLKQGSLNLFNAKALQDDSKPLFVTEGELDALSILEVSKEANALALGSTSNIDLFLDTIRNIKRQVIQKHEAYYPTILIATDNDSAGQLAARKLSQGLNNSYIDNYIVDIARNCKDPNEALTTDRNKFADTVASTIKDPDNYLVGLLKRINQHKEKPQFIPTGFSNLDQVLDGGLYPQLYVIGAISSLGKTTLAMQIADRIAARQHKHVFIFSLETSKDELTEKNLSRLTFELADNKSGNPQTARSINNGSWLDYPKESKLVMRAVEAYSKYYTYLHIDDGTESRPSAKDIYSRLNIYCSKHPNNKPVVIVDYLQILRAIDDRDTDKEKVTKSIAEFKRIATTFEVPVIVISSFNRSSYLNPAAMESFKESGEIEYYADTLIGLQLKGINNQDADLDELKNKDPRSIEAKILKNRNGRSGVTVGFSYYPKFNDFIPNDN